MEKILQELLEFFSKAACATYAGHGEIIKSQRLGFIELKYEEGPWSYRDSYCGFFQSWGEEVIWHNGKVFWTQIYGGGMEPQFQNDKDFSNQTFEFLKKALRSGEKTEFQPRGPRSYKDGEWDYSCTWGGDITKFKGNEEIRHKGKLVFTHTFVGGLVKWE